MHLMCFTRQVDDKEVKYKISLGNIACDFSRETFLISPTETTLETNPINNNKTKNNNNKKTP